MKTGVLFCSTIDPRSFWRGVSKNGLAQDVRVNLVSDNEFWDDGIYEVVVNSQGVFYVEPESDFLDPDLETIELRPRSCERV